MNKNSAEDNHLKLLGSKIRTKRLNFKQSLSEVSSSIEIEEKELLKIETGLKKPSQEVLELLIEHFKITDVEANNLFELAGYGLENPFPTNLAELFQSMGSKAIIMLSPIEQRTLFSDSLDINIDKDNIVFNFKQSLGSNQPSSVSKVAMNVNQAHQVLDMLTKALVKHHYQQGPKKLPSDLGDNRKRP